uniref:Transmembrane protein n=1 Tax=Anopheles melas TaxID=34690 RepID=A0A182UCU9_9DIPT
MLLSMRLGGAGGSTSSSYSSSVGAVSSLPCSVWLTVLRDGYVPRPTIRSVSSSALSSECLLSVGSLPSPRNDPAALTVESDRIRNSLFSPLSSRGRCSLLFIVYTPLVSVGGTCAIVYTPECVSSSSSLMSQVLVATLSVLFWAVWLNPSTRLLHVDVCRRSGLIVACTIVLLLPPPLLIVVVLVAVELCGRLRQSVATTTVLQVDEHCDPMFSLSDTCPTEDVWRETLGQSSRWARARLSVEGAASVAVGGVLIIISSSSSEWTRSLTIPDVVLELVLEMTEMRWSLLLFRGAIFIENWCVSRQSASIILFLSSFVE